MAVRGVPGVYATIQAAVNASIPGDVIQVASTYAGNETVSVQIERLVFDAPANVRGLVLSTSGQVTLAGDAPISVIGSSYNDTIVGNGGANQIDAGQGGDSVFGGDGDDTIQASQYGASGDRLEGGDGNDLFHIVGLRYGDGENAPRGIVDGGDGDADTVRAIDLGQLTYTNVEILNAGIVAGSLSQFASFSTIGWSGDFTTEIMIRFRDAGGIFDFTDRILGTDSVRIEFGYGLRSAVEILGSRNADFLAGSHYNDTLRGGAGNDTLQGQGGSDVLEGGAGDDKLTGYGLNVASYENAASGVTLDLRVTAAQFTSASTGWDALDSIAGVIGSAYADRLTGGLWNDRLVGGDGSDTLAGGKGGDTLLGGLGIDYASYEDANWGNLVISLERPDLNTGAAAGDIYESIEGVMAGTGDDTVFGSNSRDIIYGREGHDRLYGGGGDDALAGGGGGDILAGGAGADRLNGGAGIDYAAYDDGNWGDLLIRLDTPSLNTGAAAGDTYLSIEGVIGGLGNDTIFGASVNETLYGGGGNDWLYGDAGNDDLFGGDGGDRLAGGAGGDRLIGGIGADVDYASYEDANWGDLVISLANPDVNTNVAAGDTYVSIEGLIGGRGNDTIIGDANRNYLYGRSGNDTIDGGLGNDSLSGQVGADSFRFTTALGRTNVDTINDFVHGEDKILLSQAIFDGIGATLEAGEFGAAGPPTLIVYDQATGELSYDASGSTGGAAPVVFAKVTAGTVLDIDDFLMIA